MRASRAQALAWAGLTASLLALAVACGGGGSSVPACQRESPPAGAEATGPAASLTLTTGSYEGTGEPQCVRGVGFQPVLVIIKGDTGEFAVWRSATMEGDATADFASGKPNIEDAITALDLDAFSLGKDASVNAESVNYQYVAFADSPDIKLGSYVGDGAAGRVISGVGFEPVLVITKWDGLRSATWRSTVQADGFSAFFDGQNEQPGLIESFEADGFRVSSNPWVNHDGGAEPATYHYVAFRQAPGFLQTGTYVGDGGESRDITGLGFQPDYLWIKRDSTESKAVHRPAALADDATLRFESVSNGAGEIKALLPDGFQVGPQVSVNAEGDTYRYVAFKSSGP